MVKWQWQPVVEPFVGFPFLSLYGLLVIPYTFLGPTFPIISPFFTFCPTDTINSGEQWQYEYL